MGCSGRVAVAMSVLQLGYEQKGQNPNKQSMVTWILCMQHGRWFASRQKYFTRRSVNKNKGTRDLKIFPNQEDGEAGNNFNFKITKYLFFAITSIC